MRNPINADILQQVKNALLIGAIATFVGNIIEDVLTGGAGIVDDVIIIPLTYRVFMAALKY